MNDLILCEKFRKLILKKDYKSNFPLLGIFSLLNKEKLYNLNEIREFWKEYLLESKKRGIDNKISFYVHIPFCQSKCEYCHYFYWRYNSEEELDHYLESLVLKMNFFKDTFSGIKFKTLYIGGGTPSLLSEKQLKKLFTALYKNFKFEENGEKTFECNPITTTLKKLKTIERFGINRVSFGVQSTNEKILKSMNRGYQSFDLVKRVINNAKKCKFKRINVDLMIGLYGDSAKAVVENFRQVVTALKPDSISLYPLRPTEEEYLEKFYKTKKDCLVQELKNQIKDFFILIKPVALKYNYFYFPPNSKEFIPLAEEWNFVSKEYIKKDIKNPFSYKYDDTEKIDCFGLGANSCSYIFGSLNYKDIGKDFYPAGVQNPNKKIYHGLKFDNLNEQKLYYLFTELDANRLSLRAYKKLFVSDLLKDFRGPIAKLKKLNKIKIKDNSVILTSKSPCQRFIDALSFLDKKSIIKK